MGGRLKGKVGQKGKEITKGLVPVLKFLSNSEHTSLDTRDLLLEVNHQYTHSQPLG
jgi:hypothetical protein